MSTKENPMNKTIISILIWLVCMPCMVAAETSKELEEAKEEAKKEAKEEAKLMVRTAINHAFLVGIMVEV